MNFKKEIEKLAAKRGELEKPEFAERQHQKGKLTARERIELLLDPESFIELDPFVESRFDIFGLDQKKIPGDAVITGWGKINGRPVYLYSQDFSKMGGSLGELHGQKIVKVIELAQKTGCPCIGIIDSGGARIQEGISSLDGYAAIFRAMIKSSGVVPQITVIAGPSAGGASYSPGLSDFVFMVEGISQMYITGPEVIKSVTGEKISFDELGGTAVHSLKSGCAHFVFKSEQDCFSGVKKLLSFLPQNNLGDPPRQKGLFAEFFEREENLKLLEIIPKEEEKGYEMREVIEEIFDKNSFFEVQAGFATNVIIGLARLSGQVVGIVANQTKLMAGTLDIDSSDKVSRFVRFCDCFNIPLINLVDTPGYLPGSDQEHRGIIRHGAKVLYAFAEATVPKISLILRKAFGGAYIALASRQLGYDKVIAWPSAQIAVMGPEQAVKIIYKKEIAESKDPKRLEKEKIAQLREIFLNPWQAAKLGQIDMVIHPKDTRSILIKCLESLSNKREGKVARKHGNIPL
ncbi:MAG: methylmalonyl-CoA carboxyltransferase [Candidatus Nealsonbacteria bacterium CG18_big_fil_WC_8_21_14_2_50_37_10]|uniref:Methylmalonyl-CoA carboxyltransferase n=1 Tax=Candidatus Nealsonbacteria bacterium CG18_big_fil_WC_8_21_14_2_50_37_10 TaxID=1974717 RepID=A0A2H0FDV9_9BACT|nr:MAG: methylmalonyl-CoA carboxyltransferase [Candidatus Nealsonbacteria bacterium CG18_big_fil_WC_8_21_14_2_50_37_10]